MSDHTHQELADHVRRIQNSYYYEAYQSMSRPEEEGEEDSRTRRSSLPGTGVLVSIATPTTQLSPRSGRTREEGNGEDSPRPLSGEAVRARYVQGCRDTSVATSEVENPFPVSHGEGEDESEGGKRRDEERGGGEEGRVGSEEGSSPFVMNSSFSPRLGTSSEGLGNGKIVGIVGTKSGKGGGAVVNHSFPVSSSSSSELRWSGMTVVDSRSGHSLTVPPCAERFASGMSTMASSPYSSSFPQGHRDPVIVSGNGNRPLTEAVALVLGVKTHDTSVFQYESGEVHVEFHAPVIGRDVYIIQSTGGNNMVDTNTAIMELLLLIRKLRLQFAKTITAIVPFLCYSKQDCKKNLRGGFGAAVVAKMLTQMGVDRVATLDLHSHQSQGYFENTPLDNLVMVYEFDKYFRAQPWFHPERVAVVAPDARAVVRARQLADVLNVSQIVTILRRRAVNPTPGIAESDRFSAQTVLETAGSVEGLYCIVIDDMMDTGVTIVQACDLLDRMGAKSISACCTHGLLSPPAESRIMRCDALKEVVVSDSIPQEEHQRRVPKLKVVSIAPLLATVIKTYEKGHSLGCMFP